MSDVPSTPDPVVEPADPDHDPNVTPSFPDPTAPPTQPPDPTAG